MKIALVWLLAIVSAYFAIRATVFDNRLWWERRPGVPRWKVWITPFRWWNLGQYSELGENARRAANRAMGLALLFAFLALAVSQF